MLSKSNHWKVLALVLVAGSMLVAPSAEAQYITRGEVLGSVGMIEGDEGVPLAGARVVLTSEDLVTPYSTVTDADGRYRIIDIEPGSYVLTAEMAGFAASPVDVIVRVGGTTRVTVEMVPSEFADELEVTAAAPQIETVKSQVNKYVSFEEIQNLPLQNREFLDVLYTVPGVSTGVPTGTANSRGPNNSISIHGSRSNQNDFLLDGASNNDKSDLNYEERASNQVFGGPRSTVAGRAGATFQTGTALQTYSLDAVQEVQVATSMFSAEFGGGGSGGVINVITRSGTDIVNGSLTLQTQQDAWVEGEQDQDFTRNIGAVAIGGPITKGKTHYFATYEYDNHELGFDYSQPTYYVPEYLYDMRDLTANHTKRNRVTAKIGHRFANVHNLTLTGNYINEKADVLDTVFRERQIEDAVPTNHKNNSFGLILRDLLILGAEGNMNLESVLNTTGVDRAYDTSIDDPEESVFWYFTPGEVSYTIGQASSDADHEITTFGWSEKLSWSNDKLYNKVGIAVDYFKQRTHRAPWLSFSEFPEFGELSYGQIAESDIEASVTDISVFGQTDWFVSSKSTLNLGLRYGYDDLVEDHTFEPRVGWAYDLRGDGRQVLRLGGGVYHDRSNLIGVTGALRAPLEFGDIIDGEYYPSRLPNETEVDPDLHLPTIYKFVAGYQRQLGRRTTAGVTFFANLSRDLFYTDYVNRPDREGNVPDPTRGRITYYSNYGFSDVYDLEFEFRHQFSNGSLIQATYTWQDTDGASTFDFISGNDPLLSQSQYEGDARTYEVTGRLPHEVQHYVKLSGVFQLPAGFQLNTVMLWRTGSPYYWYSQWRDQNRTWNFEYYNSTYNSETLDNFFNWDLRLAKNFSLGKGYELLLFIDGFNITDEQNVLERDQLFARYIGAPDSGGPVFPNEEFDQPEFFGPRRSMQIGARFSF